MNWVVLIGGIAVAGIAAAAVYRDANRGPVGRARVWGVLVFSSLAISAGLVAVFPAIPVPGVLVIAILGPALYLFERDDATHGDAPADPHSLPNNRANDGEKRGGERR